MQLFTLWKQNGAKRQFGSCFSLIRDWKATEIYTDSSPQCRHLCGSDSRWSRNLFCEPSSHSNRTTLLTYKMWSTCHHMGMSVLPHLHLRLFILCLHWPQAPGHDVQRSSCSTLCTNWTLDNANAALHNDCSLASWLRQPSWLLSRSGSTSSPTVFQQQRRENRRCISSLHCQHVNTQVHEVGHCQWRNCERSYPNCCDQRHSLQRLASERQVRSHKDFENTLLVSVRTVTHSQCKHTTQSRADTSSFPTHFIFKPTPRWSWSLTTKHNYVKPSNLQVDDPVLLKDTTIKKSTTPFEPVPLTVVSRKGSMKFLPDVEIKSSRETAAFSKKAPRPSAPAEEEGDSPVTCPVEPDTHLQTDTPTFQHTI